MKLVSFFSCWIATWILTVSAFGAGSWNGVAVTAWNGSAITAWNGTGVSAAGGGPSYLVDEGFEGTGAPSGWTTTKGSPNYDYATSPLVGSESLFLGGKTAGDDVRVQTATFASAGAVEIYTQFRLEDFDSAGTASFVTIKNSTTVLATASFSVSKLRITPFGGTAVDTVTTLSASTVYHLWVRYVPGSGSDAAASVAFSTDGTRPASGNSYASSTNGTTTQNADRADIYGEYVATNNRYDVAVDRVLVLTGTIPDSP